MGAFAAAAVALVLIVASVGCQSGEEATATDQTPAAAEAPENTVNARAVEVATGFLEAYGAFDVEQARTYLADDATIGGPQVENLPAVDLAVLELNQLLSAGVGSGVRAHRRRCPGRRRQHGGQVTAGGVVGDAVTAAVHVSCAGAL